MGMMTKRKILICLFCLLVMLLSIGSALAKENARPEPTPFPKPGRWDNIWLNRVHIFKTENATLEPGKKNIVFLGDSLTQGFKLKKYFPDLPVLNRGIASDGVCNPPSAKTPWRGITKRMGSSVLDCNPSHVFFLIGTNDVGRLSIPLDYWFGAYKYVVGRIKTKFPDVKITVITCPPTGTKYKSNQRLNPRIIKWNAILRKYAKEQNFRLIDLHKILQDENGMLVSKMTRDGLHFNDIGFKLWAKEVTEILKQDGIVSADK
jgi:lysophospholipase L1-like esterase